MGRLHPTSVLDLGCGNCKFSRKFIEDNVPVVGVDKNLTTESKGNFKFVNKNVLDFKFEPKYDLIVGTGILHFLEKENALKLIEQMKENTLIGGYHFLICMSAEESFSNETHFYPNKELLNKLYSGWEIIHSDLCLSKKHDEQRHQHKVIIFLAKKI